jgi:hypothetical protein
MKLKALMCLGLLGLQTASYGVSLDNYTFVLDTGPTSHLVDYPTLKSAILGNLKDTPAKSFRGNFGHTLNKIRNGQSITVMTLGDSFAAMTGVDNLPSFFSEFTDKLRSAYGTNNYCDNIEGGYNTAALTGSAAWEDWNSIHGASGQGYTNDIVVPEGSTVTFSSYWFPGGQTGNVAFLFYMAGPSEGTFKLEVSTNGGAFTSCGYDSVNCLNATRLGKSIVLTNNSSPQWQLKVTTLSGTCHLLTSSVFSNNRQGVVRSYVCSSPGSTLGGGFMGASDLYATYVKDIVKPDLIVVYETDDVPTLAAAIPQLRGFLSTNAPQADVLWMGIHPFASEIDSQATGQNAVIATNCAAYGWNYFDTHSFFNARAQMDADGFTTNTDGVHLLNAGSKVLATATYNWLNPFGNTQAVSAQVTNEWRVNRTSYYITNHVTSAFDDPVLQLQITDTNSFYEIEARLILMTDGDTTQGMQGVLAFPDSGSNSDGGGTLECNYPGTPGKTERYILPTWGSWSLGTRWNNYIQNSLSGELHWRIQYKPIATGTVKLQAAQVYDSATNLRICPGSYLRVKKLQ